MTKAAAIAFTLLAGCATTPTTEVVEVSVTSAQSTALKQLDTLANEIPMRAATLPPAAFGVILDLLAAANGHRAKMLGALAEKNPIAAEYHCNRMRNATEAARAFLTIQ